MNERDKTAQMMQDSAGNSWGTEAHFQEFANLIRADEREAAEERVVDLFADMETPYLPDITRAIQAREKT